MTVLFLQEPPEREFLCPGKIANVDRLPVDHCAAGDPVAADGLRVEVHGDGSEGRGKAQDVTVDTEYLRIDRVAQGGGLPGHGVQDRLKVVGRVGDEAQYFRRGGQLFARFAQFAGRILHRVAGVGRNGSPPGSGLG